MLYTKKVLCYLSAFLSFAAFAKTDTQQLPQRPLSFTENKGQVTDQYYKQRADIDYKLSAPGISVFVGDGQLHYQWVKQDAVNITTYRMDVKLLGANRDAAVVAEQKQKDKETYYFPGIGKDGITVSLYQKITYKNVYPNIDWVLYSDGSGLKYDFVVHAGGNAKNIQLQFAGATALSLNNGNLNATTPLGSITEKAPYSYNAETREQVASKFVLNNNTLSFDVAATNGDVVIDPAVVWGTYYGGSLDENASHSPYVDKTGNVFLTGSTASTTNIATSGTFQTVMSVNALNSDGYIAKFNTNGNRVWATYFGGWGYDGFRDCSVDRYGNVYAAGHADSGAVTLMTPGAFQTAYGSNYAGDGLLVKFDANGQRLWATYWGGPLMDNVLHVACDTSDNVYFAGLLNSVGFGTSGTQQPTAPNYSYSGFLAKFNGLGQRIWSTYQNGNNGYTNIHDLYIDPWGDIYTAGDTKSNSSGDMSTSGAHQPGHGGGGAEDGFLSKFNKANGTYLWSTFYGGNNFDVVSSITGDAAGNVYIAGYAGSADGFAASVGCHQPVAGSSGTSGDGFVAKFNGTGQRQWGTYYGGTQYESIEKISVSNGSVIVHGIAQSTSGIATSGSQYPTNTPTNAFFAWFNTSGQRTYGTYHPTPTGYMDIDAYGNIYIARETSATTGISTPGAYQVTNQGGTDAYLIKLGPDTAVNINQPYTDTLFCPSSTFNLNYTVSGGFNSGNTFTAQLSDATGSFASPVTIGTATATTSGSIACTIPSGTTLGNGYRIRIVASNPAFTSMDEGEDIRVQASVTPAVSASANPSYANAGPWKNITFTAAPTAGGTAPTYQWHKNGVDIAGATSDTYTAVMQQDLVTGDVITVKMISNETCAVPDSAISAGITVNVNTTVNNVAGSKLNVYPNPTNGLLYVTGSTEAIELSIVNMTGQVVYSQQLPAGAQQRTLNIDGAIPNGVYILKLKTGDLTETLRLSVQR